jgi:hypothetical protein
MAKRLKKQMHKKKRQRRKQRRVYVDWTQLVRFAKLKQELLLYHMYHPLCYTMPRLGKSWYCQLLARELLYRQVLGCSVYLF